MPVCAAAVPCRAVPCQRRARSRKPHAGRRWIRRPPPKPAERRPESIHRAIRTTTPRFSFLLQSIAESIRLSIQEAERRFLIIHGDGAAAACAGPPGAAVRVLRGVPLQPGEPARPRGVRLAHPPHGAAPAPLRAATPAAPLLLPALPPVSPRAARLPRRRRAGRLLRAHGPARRDRRGGALRRRVGRREPPRRRRGSLDVPRRMEAATHRAGRALVRPVLRPRLLREAAAGAGGQPGAGGGDGAALRLRRGNRSRFGRRRWRAFDLMRVWLLCIFLQVLHRLFGYEPTPGFYKRVQARVAALHNGAEPPPRPPATAATEEEKERVSKAAAEEESAEKDS